MELKNVRRAGDVTHEVMEIIRHRAELGCAPIAKEYPTKKSVSMALSGAGIHSNSESFIDYAKAKNVIFRGEVICGDDYGGIIGWITEYVGV